MATTTQELALSALKAGLSAAGPLGGALASLLGDTLQIHTDHATRRAMELLGKRLDDLQERIDLHAIDRDELAELFKSCYLVILRTHHEEKLKAATALIANILLRSDDSERLSYTELDHLVRCVDSLSIGAIHALGTSFDLATSGGKQASESEPIRFNFEDLGARMPETTPSLLMGLVGELNSFNLLHIAGIPSVPEPEYANYPLQLTALGSRFVTHLLGRKQ